MEKQLIYVLDRDGTIIYDKDYLSDPSKIEFIPGAIEALLMLQNNKIPWIIASNQAGIAKGIISMEDLNRVNDRFIYLLNEYGVDIPPIKYCPHDYNGHVPPYNINCDCRKPCIGLVTSVYSDISKYNFVTIGDRWSDIMLGHNLNGISCLVRTGYGINQEYEIIKMGIKAEYVCDDLLEAVMTTIDRT